MSGSRLGYIYFEFQSEPSSLLFGTFSCFISLRVFSTYHNQVKMYSETNLTSTLGELDFSIFYFPPWLKGLYAVLGSAAFVSNSVSLGYICKKLNLSNVVNFIPLLECVNNMVGFSSMAIVSLFAYFDSTFESLTCYVNLPIFLTMVICSKYLFDNPLV